MTALVLSIILALAPGTVGGDWPDEETRVELRFEGPLRDGLRELADAADWNLVMSTEVGVLDRARVTVFVKDAPARQVLENLLEPHGLRAEREGDMVRVIAAGPDRPGPPPSSRDVRDRVAFGGDVDVEVGESVKDAVAFGGRVRIAGSAKDAVAIGGDVHVESTGRIEGDAVAVGGRLMVDPGAQVAGERVEVGPGEVGSGLAGSLLGLEDAREKLARWRQPFGWFRGIALFVVLFVLGLVAVAISPKRVLAVGETIWRRPLRVCLWGFLGAIAAALLLALLCVTIIGIPLVPLLALGLVLAVFLGFTALAVKLGSVLPIFTNKSAALSLALGTAVLIVVHYVPLVGLPLLWIASFCCFGAVLASRFGGRAGASPPDPRSAPPIPEPHVNSGSGHGSDPTQRSGL